MSSNGRALQMFQDIYSYTYRPRHANMDFNSRSSQQSIPQALPQRPKNLNTYGKECAITLNTFNVLKAPNKVVFQYDIAYAGDGKDYTKRKLLEKIWRSAAVKAELGRDQPWIWDGHRLAWWVPSVLLRVHSSNILQVWQAHAA
jgi:eukaryotic translation initiation factor 2C